MSVTKIAELAGVSQATVSKVINHYPSVSEEKAQRVRKIMEKLSYLPPSRKQQSPLRLGLVAILVLSENPHHYFNEIFARQLKGIEEALRDHGGDLLLAHVSTVEDLPNAVRKGRVDGLILVGHKPNDAVLAQIARFPSVWLTSHHELSHDVTLAGNEEVGRLAAEYLIGRNHKHLGILNALGSNPALDLRFRYFKFIAEGKGCEVDQFVCKQDAMPHVGPDLDLDMLERQVETQIERLLACQPRPTGLFVPFDIQVAMVYRILAKRGVKLDRNLEIIGDTNEKRTLAGLIPRPATINVGPEIMGTHAVGQLVLRLQNGEVNHRIRIAIEPLLVPGEEAPPASS